LFEANGRFRFSSMVVLNYLGYCPDERSATLIFDQVGVNLGLSNFPINLPNESLDDPVVSHAYLKADTLRQAISSGDVVQPVRRLTSEPAYCDEDELDDVPL
jgi:hypothetical protein